MTGRRSPRRRSSPPKKNHRKNNHTASLKNKRKANVSKEMNDDEVPISILFGSKMKTRKDTSPNNAHSTRNQAQITSRNSEILPDEKNNQNEVVYHPIRKSSRRKSPVRKSSIENQITNAETNRKCKEKKIHPKPQSTLKKIGRKRKNSEEEESNECKEAIDDDGCNENGVIKADDVDKNLGNEIKMDKSPKSKGTKTINRSRKRRTKNEEEKKSNSTISESLEEKKSDATTPNKSDKNAMKINKRKRGASTKEEQRSRCVTRDVGNKKQGEDTERSNKRRKTRKTPSKSTTVSTQRNKSQFQSKDEVNLESNNDSAEVKRKKSQKIDKKSPTPKTFVSNCRITKVDSETKGENIAEKIGATDDKEAKKTKAALAKSDQEEAPAESLRQRRRRIYKTTTKTPKPNSCNTPTKKPKRKPAWRANSIHQLDLRRKLKNLPNGQQAVQAYPPIPPGVRCQIAPYGIVEVVRDNVPDDWGNTAQTDRDRKALKRLGVLTRKLDGMVYDARNVTYKSLSKARVSVRRFYKEVYRGSKMDDNYVEENLKGEEGIGAKQNVLSLLGDGNGEKAFENAKEFEKAILQNLPDAAKDTLKGRNIKNVGDILTPVDCYPDRIVECRLIRDNRDILTDPDEKRAKQKRNVKDTYDLNIRLFLRRRLFFQLYDPTKPLFICQNCGKKYIAKESFRDHLNLGGCSLVARATSQVNADDRNAIKQKKIEQGIITTERRIETNWERMKLYEATKKVIGTDRCRAVNFDELVPLQSRTRIDKKSCLMKIKEENEKLPKNLLPAAKKTRKARAPLYTKYMTPPSTPPIIPPNTTPKKARTPKKKIKPKKPWYTFDASTSCMYPEIILTLGYTRFNNLNAHRPAFSKPNSFTSIPERLMKKRRNNREIISPPPSKMPVLKKNAPVVDTKVLVEEVNTGRYPSIRRFYGNHADRCVICKEGGIIFCCEFCPRACHLNCVRMKHTIKDFEPEDDFICHHCISKILQRRARAERRRLLKRDLAFNNDDEEDDIGETMTMAKRPSDDTMTHQSPGGNKQRGPKVQVQGMDYGDYTQIFPPCRNGGPGGLICCDSCTSWYSRMLSNTAQEMEGQSIAMFGKDVSEMIELVMDCRLRLEQALTVADENDVRRSLLEDEVEGE